jgi:uncharacterized repeat protein (TIGR01451 family)
VVVAVSVAGGTRAAGDEPGPFVAVAELLGSSDPVSQTDVEFGRTLSLSGDTLVVGAPREDTASGVDAGAAYVFVRSGGAWTLQARITASDGSPGREFGHSVSVSGDTAVIGAPLPGSGVSGKAYVFVRSGTTWTEVQQLTASDATVSRFGYSVAVSGDTAVAGAFRSGGIGEIVVFARSGTGWTEQATFVGADEDGFWDGFGSAMSIAGDTILAGAGRADGPSGPDSGAVRVFQRDGTSWAEQTTLTASDGAAYDEFGASVSLSGDTAVVGAPDAGGAAGAAYVFVRSGATWTEQQKLLTADQEAYDSAASVSVSGDTAVLGGHLSGAIVQAAGAAYVFTRSGTTWTEQPKLTASDGMPYDRFGAAVAIEGDTLAAGAPDVSGRAGAVYFFGRSGVVWSEQAKVSSPGTDTTGGDLFGASISVFGDTVAVGAPDDHLPVARYGGSAYAFVRSGQGWSRQKLVASNAGSNDHFGTSVSASSDTIVVGAPDIGAPSPIHGSGYAYVFVRDGTSWSEQQILGASWTQLLGASVSLSGDTAVVGGPGRPPYYDTGDARVYVRSGTTWTEQQRLVSPLGATYDEFGSSVAVNGDTLAVVDGSATYVFVRSGSSWTLQQALGVGGPVSIYGDTLVVGRHVFVRSGATWTQQQLLALSDAATSLSSVHVSETRLVAGRASTAYVFERVGLAWIERQRLVAPAALPGDGFGTSVSVSGGTVVVGARGRDTVLGADSGAALVFEERRETADLWIRKTDDRAAVMPGGSLTYTITVGNAGPDGVEGAVVTDVLPAALTCTTTCAGTGGATCRTGPFEGSVTDSVGIPPRQAVTYTSACTVSASATGNLSNTATVTPHAAVNDPFPQNNSATDTDTLDPAADLAMSLTQSTDNATPGGVLDYTITVTNQGPWPSTGMTVRNVQPSGTALIASIPGSSLCSLNGRTLECNLGPLAVGDTHTVMVEVAVDASVRGVLTDRATVSGHEPDLVPDNDSDTVVALVSAPTQFFTIAPCRLVDTRNGSTAPVGGPALAARSKRVIAVAGHCGIPATAQAAAVNVTVTGAGAGGNLRLFPAGLSVPLATVVSYREGQTRGNNGVVALGANGAIVAYAGQAARTKVDLIIDVTGYFE